MAHIVSSRGRRVGDAESGTPCRKHLVSFQRRNTILHYRVTPYLKLLTLISLLLSTATGWSAEDFPALRKSIDTVLQEQLQQIIEKTGLQNAVDQKRLAITLVDLCDQDKPRVASINGDVMEYAASLPKIALLLTAFVQIEQGRLVLHGKLEADLTAMIRHSSNEAATRVLDLVGREDLALFDRADELGGLQKRRVCPRVEPGNAAAEPFDA